MSDLIPKQTTWGLTLTTERREIFGREDIKLLAQTYQTLVDELSVVYFNQDDAAIEAADAAVDALLMNWGMWDDTYGWIY